MDDEQMVQWNLDSSKIDTGIELSAGYFYERLSTIYINLDVITRESETEEVIIGMVCRILEHEFLHSEIWFNLDVREHIASLDNLAYQISRIEEEICIYVMQGLPMKLARYMVIKEYLPEQVKKLIEKIKGDEE